MTFDEFWLAYLGQHRKAGTRLCHYIGTSVGLVGGIGLAVWGAYLAAVAVAVSGYALALAGHFLIEGNKPYATKPLWGFYADLLMLKKSLTGELQAELQRLEPADAPVMQADVRH
jgi:hypothetical protein